MQTFTVVYCSTLLQVCNKKAIHLTGDDKAALSIVNWIDGIAEHT